MNLINTYTNVGETILDNMQVTQDTQRRGKHDVTLTEMDTTTIPQVAAGSVVEVGNSLYESVSDETISGSATTGTNYIYLVPGSSIVTPTWTATAPTWSDAKQGWYGTGGSAGYRYIEYAIYYDGASSYNKYYKFERYTLNPVYKTLIKVGITTSYFPAATWDEINFDKKVFDIRNEFNLTTDVFTPSESGVYRFNLNLQLGIGDSEFLHYGFCKDGLPTSTTDTDIIASGYCLQSTGGAERMQVNSLETIEELDFGDTVYFYSNNNGASAVSIIGDDTRYNSSFLTIEQIIN